MVMTKFPRLLLDRKYYLNRVFLIYFFINLIICCHENLPKAKRFYLHI